MKPHYDNVRASEGGEWPDFKDTQLIMYKPQVPGFLLTQKTWARLAVNQIKTTSGGVSTVSLDHLCLTDDDDSNNTKHLIQNLIHNHGKKETEKPPDVPDLPQGFVEGKSKGLPLANRINTFDIAVQSRVNLAVHFTDMSEKQQRRVFNLFLNMIDEKQSKTRI
ncbi:hypothetical protein OEA41_010150 [Lepraria neglecta]|uniref:Uncharacterized protein n=1 Tax=Lepraria neglecta TaxID=209136 RepID=A0AAD9YWQ8_9LECA|nr:hypothetical protein OEA41_010150 [Lepraria neglecta]